MYFPFFFYFSGFSGAANNLKKAPARMAAPEKGANWQDWLPVPVPLYTVPPVPSGHGAMINPIVLAQLQQRKA